MPAPFFEHALQSSWMDLSYTFLDRLWFDGDKVVAFVYYESPVTDIYFNVRKGYEFLADELIDYAMTTMPNWENKQQLVLSTGQDFLKEAASKRGFQMINEYDDRIFDFRKELDYKLPDGYHFVEQEYIDINKLAKLCWDGFDHDGSPEFNLVIADDKEDYACFSGMWWVPENHLAYMEPLCTAPKHRRKGLAAAALSKHYHRMKALGATHMTGGSNPFYEKIGYEKGSHWTFWKNIV